MENRAAQRATSAICVSAPKSTMLEIVEATLALMWVMMRTPKKLKTALMMIAGRTRMQRVVTQVAMALGASVQPLTKMTPRVRATVMANMGDESTCWTKYASETSKIDRFLLMTAAVHAEATHRQTTDRIALTDS